MRVFQGLENSKFAVDVIPAIFDNFMYGIRWGTEALIIDPSEAELVIQWARERNLRVTTILNTHHHEDHVFGNLEVKQMFNARILGPPDSRIPGQDRPVADGERIEFGAFSLRVLSTPGHGAKDISLVLEAPAPLAVFTADTVFGAGCGRLFEGTPDMMMQSFSKIGKLPDETLLFFGHEYTVENLRFARILFPGNKAIADRLAADEAKVMQGLPTAPSTLALEKATNPFFLARDVDEFAAFRKRRDSF